MMHQTAALQMPQRSAPTERREYHQSPNMIAYEQHLHEQSSEDYVSISPSSITGFNRGEHQDNSATTSDCIDFLTEKLRRKTAKQISRETGINARAAESVKQGRNALTMAHLVNMMRADPSFRAEFFRFAGGHLEGEPELVAALSRAINQVVAGRNT